MGLHLRMYSMQFSLSFSSFSINFFQEWHLMFGENKITLLCVAIPNEVLAGTASLLIQKETQERTTISVQGM